MASGGKAQARRRGSSRSQAATAATLTAAASEETKAGAKSSAEKNHASSKLYKPLPTKLEKLKEEIVHQFESKISELIDSVIEESSSTIDLKSAAVLQNGGDVEKVRSLRPLPEKGKLFLPRPSVLDELFEINHVRTIYHMFIAVLMLFVISTVAVDFIDQGRLVLDFDLLVFAFGQLPTALWAWLCMFLGTLLVPYWLLCRWGTGYQAVHWHGLYTAYYGLLYFTFQVLGLGVTPVFVVVHYSLPPASRFILILEQVRLVMKAHSFVRENVPRIMQSHCKGAGLNRCSVIRTPTIRWKFVAMNFAQVLGCLFYAYYVFVRLCIPLFRNFGKEPLSIRVLVLNMFNCTLPGVLILLLAFFAFLHCWLNAFAEMLRFADRMFYQDWWNSTSFANYYRTWNVVVHDWLYYYTYRDFRWAFSGRFKAAAMFSVFSLSAVVHEYVLTVCLGFFYPVMFVLFFGFGMLFNFVVHDKRKSPIWNVVMWTFLFIGQGIMVCLYSLEWYAQQHCPAKEETFFDLITPLSWSCQPFV
ncbi:sterol O-acyltransferase 1 isoform X3 [Lampetra fluviatilis]